MTIKIKIKEIIGAGADCRVSVRATPFIEPGDTVWIVQEQGDDGYYFITGIYTSEEAAFQAQDLATNIAPHNVFSHVRSMPLNRNQEGGFLRVREGDYGYIT